MKLNVLLAAVLAAPLLSVSACATDRAPRPEEVAELKILSADATMPFAQYRSTIRSWTVRADDSLLIEGNNGKWYHATFMGACPWVDTATRIGFKTNPGGNLDKFAGVQAEGYDCSFKTFDEVADPRPPKA